MHKLTKEELKTKLELHRQWALGEKNGKKLNLRDVDLSDANLTCAYLSGASFTNVNLTGANLTGTSLRDAVLMDVNLSYADLSYADLSYADLIRANLFRANLRHVNLNGANLSDNIMHVSSCDGIKGVNLVLISNVGSQRRRVVYDIDKDVVYCGCWESNLGKFKKRIEDIYGKKGSNHNEQYYEEYQNVISHFETKLKYAVVGL